MRIAYLGPPGTFSHEMALKIYPTDTLCEARSLDEVVKAVQSKLVDAAVLPIENSTNGYVKPSIESICITHLSSAPVYIHNSHWLPIHHMLYDFDRPRSSVQRLYSHPQVWGQIEKTIAGWSVELVDCSSTAAAIDLALADPNGAAVASVYAGKLTGKTPSSLASLSDRKDNKTHFVVLRTEYPTAKPVQYLWGQCTGGRTIYDQFGRVAEYSSDMLQGKFAATCISLGYSDPSSLNSYL